MAWATLLLPPAAHFGRAGLFDASLRATLARADRTVPPENDRRTQLLRYFTPSPDGWSIAALSRQADVGDAGVAYWLSADPAYVRPDINGARLMAYGEALALGDEDVAALLPALRTVFDTDGCTLDAPSSSRWFLRLAPDADAPAFDDPAQALGEDVFDHFPSGDAGRHWRGLLNEAQVVLHNHPWNAHRTALGKPSVNAVWCWGGGVMPDAVRAQHRIAYSDDDTARALAQAAGECAPLPPLLPATSEDALFDLSTLRDRGAIVSGWVQPAVAAVRSGALSYVRLDVEDGDMFVIERGQRWRFWRKPTAGLQ